MTADIDATEVAAIRRVLAGEVDAFRFLVERHERSVFRLVGGLLNDAHAREDVAQETFLAAYRNLAAFDPGRGCFSTWLLTIARNLCLNALRKKSPVALADPPEKAALAAPEENLAGREWIERLNSALERLPEAQRTAFVLAELLELPYEQIARIEGTQMTTVRANASKARERLRSLLHEFSGGYR